MDENIYRTTARRHHALKLSPPGRPLREPGPQSLAGRRWRIARTAAPAPSSCDAQWGRKCCAQALRRGGDGGAQEPCAAVRAAWCAPRGARGAVRRSGAQKPPGPRARALRTRARADARARAVRSARAGARAVRDMAHVHRPTRSHRDGLSGTGTPRGTCQTSGVRTDMRSGCLTNSGRIRLLRPGEFEHLCIRLDGLWPPFHKRMESLRGPPQKGVVKRGPLLASRLGGEAP